MFKLRSSWLSLVVLGIIVTIFLGYRFWKQREPEFYKKLERPAKFVLMDIDAKIYDSTATQGDIAQLYLFLPNSLSKENMQAIAQFSRAFEKRWQGKVDLVLISRIGLDLLQNLRGITQFKGRILNDPSGTVGRLFGFWNQIDQDDGWHYRLVEGKTANLLWAQDSPTILENQQFEKIFIEAINKNAK